MTDWQEEAREEIRRRMRPVPWGRRERVFALVIAVLALANLLLNMLVLLQ